MVKHILGVRKMYTLKQLEAMETVHKGHFDDLKFDNGVIQIWLSRMTIEDGMPYNNQVIESWCLNTGEWLLVNKYEAK